MSIYRRTDRAPATEFDYEPDPMAQRASESEADWAKRRMSEPASGLLKPTFAWASTLPVEIQPRALLYKFPRIANLIAVMWRDANSLRRYMDDLLVDRRGDRNGFPVEVLRELFQLRAHYDQLHPDGNLPWEAVDKKS